YVPFVILAVWYELVLGLPSEYTHAHLVASAAHGVAAGCVLLGILWDVVRTRSPLVRRRIGLVAFGSVIGFAVPGAAMLGSVALGGTVPVNVAAFTAFAFPVSLGYAVVQRDLFEIDTLLRR